MGKWSEWAEREREREKVGESEWSEREWGERAGGVSGAKKRVSVARERVGSESGARERVCGARKLMREE